MKDKMRHKNWGESKTRPNQSLMWRNLWGTCIINDHQFLLDIENIFFWQIFTIYLCWFSLSSDFLYTFILPCLETTLFFLVWALITPRIPRDFRANGFHLKIKSSQSFITIEDFFHIQPHFLTLDHPTRLIK